MPGYQDRSIHGRLDEFCAWVNLQAESIFSQLLPQLDPELLVVMHKKHKGKSLLSVIPYGKYQAVNYVEDFEPTETSREDPRRLIFSPPEDLNSRQEVSRRLAFTDKLSKALEAEEGNRAFFFSYPQEVEGYLVSAVLSFEQASISLCNEIKSDVDEHPFIAMVAAVFLRECSLSLENPTWESTDAFRRHTDDYYLRAAGRQLLGCIIYLHRPWPSTHRFNLPPLFEWLSVLSSLSYESQEVRGKLLITKDKENTAEPVIVFTEFIKIQDSRAARKVLEMASERLNVVADPLCIYGLGRRIRNESINQEDNIFEVSFIKRNIWEVSYKNQVFMRVKDGLPKLPRKNLEKSVFQDKLFDVFKDDLEIASQNLWEIAELAKDQKHGTIIVISAKAAQEANRLSGQSTCINPTPILCPEVIRSITSIDGAVLIDTSGKCFAIGVILDGMAIEDGDSSRGARYNSALRYVKMKQEKGVATMALVVSEDGMIDLLPKFSNQAGQIDP